MNYRPEKPKTIQGVTFQAVCSVADTTVIRGRSLFVSRQKTPIIILVLGDGDPKVFDLSGNALEGKIIEDIQCQIPAVRGMLN